MDLAIGFLLGVIGSWIVSILVVPLTETYVHKWIVRLLGSYKQRARNVAGYWTQCWEVESDNFESSNEALVKIKQFGRRVFTSFYAGSNKYFFSGRIDQGRYVTGKWYGEIKGDYHGSFQLHIAPNGQSMDGIWLGFDSKSNVKTGHWTWKRYEVNVRREPVIEW